MVVLLVVGAYEFYPRPEYTTHDITCGVLIYGIISAQTVNSGGTEVPVNLTETTMTNFSTTTNIGAPPGKVVTTFTSSTGSGFNGYGQYTHCTYLNSTSSST